MNAAHALAYATKLPGTLLPVQAGGKRPAINDWPARATRNPETLSGWFEGGSYNIGWQPDECHVVVDLDTKVNETGVTGFDTLATIEARYGRLPETLRQVTPTGGHHLVFRVPAGTTAKNLVGNKSGFPGLDIRAKGGQIVVEPSIRPEGEYRWQNWRPLEGDPPVIADAPDWLVKLACSELEPIAGKVRQKPAQVGDDCGIVAEGARNSVLVSEACALRRKGWREAAITAALLELNRTQFDSPVPEREVEDVAAWACGKYESTPGADIAEAQSVEDWQSRIDSAAGDAAAITMLVRLIQAAPALSEIERDALFRRAAKAAGCNIGSIRAEAAKATALQPVAASGGVLPLIRISSGDFAVTVDEAVTVLPSLDLYQQEGRLVQAVPSLVGGVRIEPVELPHLSYLLSKGATWRRVNAEGVEVPASPDRDTVAAILARKYWPGVRPLAGIARQPILRDDGTIVMTGGYCTEAMRLLAFDPGKFPAWPGSPKEALNLLLDLLAEFPFETEEDKSAALAGMLTGAMRKSLDTAPGFFVKAHVPGSSKSFLSTLISQFAGERAAPCTWAESATEQRKALLAALLNNPDALLFDNLDRDLKSPHLARALTETAYRDRELGQSRSPEASTQALFIFNGNNCGPVADLCRRFVTIRLDPGLENPHTRSFSGDPVAQVAAHRGRYVMAALAIVQGWIAAGSPREVLPPIVSYNAWTDWVRQPLVWLGLPDPGARLLDNAAQADPDREQLGRLLRLWCKTMPEQPVPVRHVVDKVWHADKDGTPYGDLNDVLLDIAGEGGNINRKRLGWWLKSHEGAIVAGLKLLKHEGGDRTSWQVVRV
jgi:hypothetical protein